MRNISVVIPTFNSSQWLSDTYDSLIKSLNNSTVSAEIIFVDDGSTDNSAEIINNFDVPINHTFKMITQSNQGRFLARWSGIEASENDQILLLDSRVILNKDAFSFIEKLEPKTSNSRIWNGYVVTDSRSTLAGLFWDVPTRLFWGKFLKKPIRTSFDFQNFDKFPKGTGMFLAPKEVLVNAYKAVWPKEGEAYISDDTRLIRYLSQKNSINIDPIFGATYIPRTSLAAFITHTYNRGIFFVDSYAGTSLLRKFLLLAFAIVPFICLTLLFSGLLFIVVLIVFLSLLVIISVGAFNGAKFKSIFSFCLLAIPFGFVFWLGLIRGLFIHKHYFSPLGRT